MRIDRSKFFSAYRDAFGPLKQLQVDGLEFLLSAIESDPGWKSLPQVAYFLATVRHETGISRNNVDQTYQPIKELRAKAGTKVRKLQDRYWGSDYYGRGFIQLTWEFNYAKFGLADNPDDALKPDVAYMVAARGMREGKFTRYKLSDFVNGKVDYVNARKVVNGLDKAKHIAAIAEKFERMLRTSLVTDSVTDETKAVDVEKGVTTSDKPSDETAGTPPPAPAVEVKASEVPFWTRITSISIPAGVVSAVGAVIAFAKDLPPFAWIALSVIVVAGMVIGYLVWKDGKAEAHERTKIVMSAAADRDKNNLRLV
jgi:hypothetical protein